VRRGHIGIVIVIHAAVKVYFGKEMLSGRVGKITSELINGGQGVIIIEDLKLHGQGILRRTNGGNTVDNDLRVHKSGRSAGIKALLLFSSHPLFSRKPWEKVSYDYNGYQPLLILSTDPPK